MNKWTECNDNTCKNYSLISALTLINYLYNIKIKTG